jgi:glycosyltransferase involved in cell wall biosynthesis
MKVVAWPAFKTRYKNPYNWLLYSALQAQGVQVAEFSAARLLTDRCDILHLHWPVETLVRHPNVMAAVVRTLIFWFVLTIAKLRGAKVIWTVHDQKPHHLMHAWLANRVQAALVHWVDGYIRLCHSSQQLGQPDLTKPSFIIPHGHYRDAYPNTTTATAARADLNIPADAFAFLFLGYISPYKNVLRLVKLFRQLSASQYRLIIAGNPEAPDLAKAIQTAAKDDPRIHLHLRFIADQELQTFYNAANLVVLPFAEILNSGSALLALSFNRPVLAPRLGAMPEWQARFGADWVQTYDGELTAAALLAASRRRPADLAAGPALESLNWSDIGRQTVAAYQSLQQGYS